MNELPFSPAPAVVGQASAPPPPLPALGPPGGPGTAGAAVSPGGAHGYDRKCPCPVCERKRAEWRRRGKESYARRVGQAPALDRPGSPPVPASAPQSGAEPALAPDPLRVPWRADTLRPLVANVANAVEKWDAAGLIKEAAQIAPEEAALVKAKAAWPGDIKESLVRSGSAVAAKWMNQSPVGGEWAEEVEFCTAAAALVASRQSLVAELRKLAAGKKAEVRSQEGKHV